MWLLFEVCEGEPLSKLLWQNLGDFHNGERIYKIFHNPEVYEILESDNFKHFKLMIRKILEALDLLKEANIIHSDLKPENILVDLDYENLCLKSVKLIDMGSSCQFSTIDKDLALTTPEYLPPEVLEHVNNKSNYHFLSRLHPWSIDVWSLGVVLLEITLGYPVWLSYRGRIVCLQDGEEIKSEIITGLFGVNSRDALKIVKL